MIEAGLEIVSQEASFELPQEGGESLLKRIVALYPHSRSSFTEEVVVYLDSFDGRLYRAGWTLEAATKGRRLEVRLVPLKAGRSHRVMLEERPRSARDFPAGFLGEELGRILEARLLIPRLFDRRAIQSFDLQDRARKIVTRVQRIQSHSFLEEPGPGSRKGSTRAALSDGIESPPLLLLSGVRGYDAFFERALSCAKLELGHGPKQTSLFQRLALLHGLDPGNDPSKLRIRLDSDGTIEEAVRQILLHLLGTMKANEKGVLEDLDIEFLHDYRVAIRRTRSILSQLRGVFPKVAEEHYTGELRWLGSVTGPVRDLDVLLENEPMYRRQLGDGFATSLDPLQAFVRKQRESERKLLTSALRSKRCQHLIRNWGEFLSGEGEIGAAREMTNLPAWEVASRKIQKRYKKILRLGRAVGPETPIRRIHDVRIECKKLRYLLECFGSLFPKKASSVAVLDLKALQSNLGDLNDYEVHGELFSTSATRMMEEGDPPAETMLAVGRLVAFLEAKRENERQGFFERFVRFASSETQTHFAEAFGVAGDKHRSIRTKRKKKRAGDDWKRIKHSKKPGKKGSWR